MIRTRDVTYANELSASLRSYTVEHRQLSGLNSNAELATLVAQLIESTRRVRYVQQIRTREISPVRADPNSEMFNPLHAATRQWALGDKDEAFWLTFLATHFGKNRKSKWNLLRSVYGRLGDGRIWTWRATSLDPSDFVSWLDDKQAALRPCGAFGNHRKYQSLDAMKPYGTGAAVRSYIEWVMSFRSHQELIASFQVGRENDQRALFDALYKALDVVISFGRTAKFDYLTMLSNLGFAPIQAGATYMQGATGPYRGARRLFGAETTRGVGRVRLDGWVTHLGDYLGLSMQVMEDALCNWQKSPTRFKKFRG